MSDSTTGQILTDLLYLLLFGLIVILIILIFHINPPTQARENDIEQPGNMLVELRWPDDRDVDLDLWVQGPKGPPVGYSNKGGILFNLLRDDLGLYNDESSLNYEISTSRGLPAGDYTVNVHYYNKNSGPDLVEAEVLVSIKKDAASSAKQVLKSVVKMTFQKQELTVFRFKIDEHGNVITGTVHNQFKALRAANSIP